MEKIEPVGPILLIQFLYPIHGKVQELLISGSRTFQCIREVRKESIDQVYVRICLVTYLQVFKILPQVFSVGQERGDHDQGTERIGDTCLFVGHLREFTGRHDPGDKVVDDLNRQLTRR